MSFSLIYNPNTYPNSFWTLFGNSDNSAAVPKAKGPMRV